MSAWSDSGMSRCDRSPTGRYDPSSAARRPSWSSIRTVSTAYSGTPSARSRMSRPAASGRPGTRPSRPSDMTSSLQRLERERDGVASPRSPVRAAFEQLGPRQRHDQDRMRAAPLEHVVDEVEEARIGPLEVLEDEDRHAQVRDALEERAPGREQLLALAGAAFLEAEQLEEPRLDPAPLLRRRGRTPRRSPRSARASSRRRPTRRGRRASGPSRRAPRT